MGKIKTIKTEPTRKYEIFIGGDYQTAVNLCQEYCAVGLCVTITPTVFAYTFGQEQGVRIGLVNYPRFPSSAERLESRAKDLGLFLLDGLAQGSFLIVGPNETTWYSRRDD